MNKMYDWQQVKSAMLETKLAVQEAEDALTPTMEYFHKYFSERHFEHSLILTLLDQLKASKSLIDLWNLKESGY